MNASTAPVWEVRAAWGALKDLSIGARRIGTALVELLDWPTWASPEPMDCDNPRRGITRRAIAERANSSVRTVTRALAELRLSGLVTVKQRVWLQSWYALDAAELLRRARAARSEAREARSRAVLRIDRPAVPPPPRTPGAEALERAARAVRPRWADSSARPDDLARLVRVYTSALHPGQPAELFEGRYAARLEKLRREHDSMPLDRLAEQLMAVAAWVRGDGRVRERGRRGVEYTRTVEASQVLRPRLWSQVVDLAVEWWRDHRSVFDPVALADALIAAQGAPASDAAALTAARALRDAHSLTERQESAVLYELLQRVPGRDTAEPAEDAPDQQPPEALDPGLLAKLALCVPEVEQLAAEISALPPLPDADATLPFPQRRGIGAQRRLRGLLSEEAAQWLRAASELLAAQEAGSPARLHDLAEALSRLRDLRGRLAR